jgi:murein L,D-transpeptidase YafK
MKKEIKSVSPNKVTKRLLTPILFIICGTTFYLLLSRIGFLVPLSDLGSVLCFSSCKPESPIHPVLEGKENLNYDQSLSKLLGNQIEKEKISVLIEKSKYRLTIFYNLQPIKSYPVVLGGNPTGNKLHEGDQKTPEGKFHIRDLNSHPQWSKFMWLDYPTPQSWRKHFQAKAAGQINWLLPIGGEVGIHGVAPGADGLINKRINWTWGCISLKNNDVNEIAQVAKVGTLVEIVP